jgi:hypothetical protein
MQSGPVSWGDSRISNFCKNVKLLEKRLDGVEGAKYLIFKKAVEDSPGQNEKNIIGFGLNVFLVK